MKILVAQKQREARQFVETCLNEMGHKVYLAENGAEAWDMLSTVMVDMVIADWIMPNMHGPELCRQIRDAEFEDPVYVILVTDQDNDELIAEGFESECDDFLSAPIRLQELRVRLEIGAKVLDLTRQALIREEDIKKNYFQTISMFTSLIEVFDEDLGGHCRRTGNLCLDLAKRHPAVEEANYSNVEIAGYLHDIGMIGLPNEILLKRRTERNDDERKAYLSHPARGEIILDEIEFLKPIAAIVRAHHEQFNGRGFPDGLSGEEISPLAMIVSVASIYDNFLNRGRVSLEEIPKDMERMRGYQLEPFIVDLLLEINHERIQEEETKDFICFRVSELTEGMVVFKDIRMKTGALAMPFDTTLTSHNIEKLTKYLQMDCIENKVCVKKRS